MGRSLLACSKSVDRCVRFSGEGAPPKTARRHRHRAAWGLVGPTRRIGVSAVLCGYQPTGTSQVYKPRA